jgi:hypothetical protein
MGSQVLDPGDSERERMLHEIARLQKANAELLRERTGWAQTAEARLKEWTEARAQLAALTVADAERPKPAEDRIEPLRRILGVGRALLSEVDEAMERLFDHADALDAKLAEAERVADEKQVVLDEERARRAEAERVCAEMREEIVVHLVGQSSDGVWRCECGAEADAPEKIKHSPTCALASPIGSGWLSPTEAAALRERAEKAERFKAYVHKRLDEAGVPVDPPSPHREQGCRIGGRLDYVLAEAAQKDEQLSHVLSALMDVRRAIWAPGVPDATRGEVLRLLYDGTHDPIFAPAAAHPTEASNG